MNNYLISFRKYHDSLPIKATSYESGNGWFNFFDDSEVVASFPEAIITGIVRQPAPGEPSGCAA